MDNFLALVYVVWFIITFFFIVTALTFIGNRKDFHRIPKGPTELPRISVVVPAFNEERGIAQTVDSLLRLDYPKDKLDVIVVNDGSKDRTGDILKPYAERGDIVYVEQKNAGKAAALNVGFQKATSEFVGTIDADTVVEPDVLKKTLPFFYEEDNICAVIVRVAVLEPKNWLERIIAVEYNLGLGFYPKIISYLDSLYLTPGQFSMYKREAVIKIGGFDPRSIVEDTEIVYRMQKAGQRIACCPGAVAYTRVPDNIRDLYFQRKRWYTGTIQTLITHKDAFFNRSLGNFGMFFLPLNYGGNFLGIALFIATVLMFIQNTSAVIENYYRVGFDFTPFAANFIRNYQFDGYATVNMFILLAITPFIMNLTACIVGMKIFGESIRKNLFGFISFLFFFLPYHIFWIISIYIVAAKKQVKWREVM
ncbi:Glycosyltransferase AglI [uncultured archaeon]|nr:Glycosyltransferase AglI [uncultured archaeon]